MHHVLKRAAVNKGLTGFSQVSRLARAKTLEFACKMSDTLRAKALQSNTIGGSGVTTMPRADFQLLTFCNRLIESMVPHDPIMDETKLRLWGEQSIPNAGEHDDTYRDTASELWDAYNQSSTELSMTCIHVWPPNFDALIAVRTLYLEACSPNFEAVSRLINLVQLRLVETCGVPHLNGIYKLTQLESLELSHHETSLSLKGLEHLTKLKHLDLRDTLEVEDYEPLRALVGLRQLVISDDMEIPNWLRRDGLEIISVPARW